MRPWSLGFGIGLIAGITSLGLAVQARPSFSPRNSSFTAKGQVSVLKGSTTNPCAAHLVGNTDAAGIGTITGATFTGSDFCTAITSNGLPWTMNAETKQRATLHSVAFTTIYGNCGPVNASVFVNSAGRFTFHFFLNPDCVLNGYVKTTPAVTIVKP